MPGLLKLTDAFSLAIHAMAYMGCLGAGRPASVASMAAVLGVSQAHLAKVLQALARRGMLISRRGAKGGFELARRPRQLSLLEIHDAIDGPLPHSPCLLDRPVCAKGRCVLSELIGRVYRQTHDHLVRAKLSDLMAALPTSDGKTKRSPRGSGKR